jgi:hypothetical protein
MNSEWIAWRWQSEFSHLEKINYTERDRLGTKAILTLFVIKTRLSKTINQLLKEAIMKNIKAISSRAFLGLSKK